MHSLFLWAALSLSANPLGDGTLIFLENCNSVVEYSTKGKIGHVAIVINEAEGCWVYEATPGEVRRVLIDDYFAEVARINQRRDAGDQVRVWSLTPTPAYNSVELAAMQAAIDKQLGRRYSVRNYVRSRPGDGIHCAELTALALNASGRFALEDGAKIHPSALYAALDKSEQYGPPNELPLASTVAPEPWCLRAQRRTTEWFSWCGWSCQEAWLWCW